MRFVSYCLAVGASIIATLPAKGSGVEVPFELLGRHALILVTAQVGSRDVTLALDTGATHTMISPKASGVTQIDLKKARFAASNPGLTIDATVHAVTLRFAGHEWRNRPTPVTSFDEVSRLYGREIDGLLGQDILTTYGVVTIDYQRKKLTLGPR